MSQTIDKPASFVPCPGGCDHTEAEHSAWDQGWMAGNLDHDAKNPFDIKQHNLWYAWESGASVGRINSEKKA